MWLKDGMERMAQRKKERLERNRDAIEIAGRLVPGKVLDVTETAGRGGRRYVDVYIEDNKGEERNVHLAFDNNELKAVVVDKAGMVKVADEWRVYHHRSYADSDPIAYTATFEDAVAELTARGLL
ncbi:MAG: hypothetical protein KM310_06985 [Clostridiales bacterium]|nr:hypothetical protein [Clostridiales bacterium]